MKSKHTFGLISLITLAAALLWVRHEKELTEKGEDLYLELKQDLQKDFASRNQTRICEQLTFLMRHEKLHHHVADLANDSSSLEYQPATQQAYLIHTRGDGDRCLCALSAPKKDSLFEAAHAGYPDYLQITSLQLAGDQLRVFGHIEDDHNYEIDLNGIAVQSGQEVCFQLDRSGGKRGSIGFDQLGPPTIL